MSDVIAVSMILLLPRDACVMIEFRIISLVLFSSGIRDASQQIFETRSETAETVILYIT